ncbi:MAG TPA: nitronate monooxygenase [Thermomicrobiales bacterium]|jgi:NAD(P)H-dependent flavin oxidoreductase YrpB (nitropropane dioxygenase family)
MLTTRFTELIGCSLPIQLAGMGGLRSPSLPAAVSEAGGLGTVGAAGMGPAELAEYLDRIAAQTARPIGVNFLMPFVDRDAVAVAAGRVRLVEFFSGEPERKLVALVHADGALAGWQVGSRREAIAAAAAGCDLVVAQGIEAGGHVRGKIGMVTLLGQVLDAVDLPVLAAGGIGTGRAMAAALAAGAAGVRVGTRVLAATEAEDTVVTEVFALDWSADSPHRVLRSGVEAVQAFAGDIVGEYPPDDRGARTPIHRFETLVPMAGTSGTVAAMSLWAGESVGAVTRLEPAAVIARELAADAERLLRRWGEPATTGGA